MSAVLIAPERDLMLVEVTRVREEAEGVRSFELRDRDGGDLPPFEAGAHVEVEVHLADGRPGLRHYSLLGDPTDRSCYWIGVLREPDSRGGSRFMHERVALGSSLRISRPINDFPLESSASHSILIAGGIGITPILSMSHALTQRGQSFELHYAARTPERMAFRDRIEAIAGAGAYFYHTHIERPDLFDLRALLSTPRMGTHVYACGPLGLIRAVTEFADEGNWPKSQIHFESFGGGASSSNGTISLYLERSEISLQVGPGETLLDAILEAGVWAPYECRRGTCASCMTRVVAGEPDHRDACLSSELQATYMCPCVSRAHSDHLTLDL
jgi:vanillate O-demethylase ferredoxin subunit